jgi:peptide/nickel transport system permease protein
VAIERTGPSQNALEEFENARSRRVGITWRRQIGNLLRVKSTVAGFLIVLALVLIAILAPVITIHDPSQIEPARRLSSPSTQHFFGTDHLGRDVFARMVFGAQVSLVVGALIVLTTGIVGCVLGLLSGYYLFIDNLIMRITDGLMAFPGILLALGLMASLGPKPSNLVIALSVVYSAHVIRITRAVTLTVRRADYVEAATVMGARDHRILGRHIFPNTLGPVMVQLTFIFAFAVLAEAALSFLGVGVQPGTPTWGNILREGRSYLHQAPWLTLFPGFAIMITVLGLNLFGDGLRDYLDPRLR